MYKAFSNPDQPAVILREVACSGSGYEAGGVVSRARMRSAGREQLSTFRCAKSGEKRKARCESQSICKEESLLLLPTSFI